MKILITAGGTYISIDQVRGISNIFNGRTGISIAKHLFQNENDVTLLLQKRSRYWLYLNRYIPPVNCHKFLTYDDLYSLMEKEIAEGKYDVIIHSAAVSDYKVDGLYINDPLDKEDSLIRIKEMGKYSSQYSELFLKLIQTEKIINKIRTDWNFQGVLVKFKLEVGLDDEELILISKKSRIQSDADIIVANCLEWAKKRAYIITDDSITNIPREMLSYYLYGKICQIV